MKKWLLVALLVPLLTMAQKQGMTPQLLWKLGRVGLDDVSPAGKEVLYGIKRYDLEANKGHRDLYILNNPEGEQRLLLSQEKSVSNGQFINKQIGYAYDGQYYIMNRDGSGKKQLTNIEDGISGVKVFPQEDGRLALLFTVKVKVRPTPEDRYPALDKANFRVIEDMMYRHWDQWDDYKAQHVALAYYNGETITEYTDLMQDEPYESPVPPFGGSEAYTMSPDGAYVVYETKRKTGVEFSKSTNSNLYAYEVATKNTTLITKGMEGYDKSPAFSPNGKYLAFTSMKEEGYESDVNDLVIMDWPSMENKRHLLQEAGEYDNLTLNSFAWSDSKTIYASVPRDGTNQLYAVNVKKARFSPIMTDQHNYNQVVPAGDELIVTRQDMNHATEIYNVNVEKQQATALTHVNDAVYNRIGLSKIEERRINTTDGKEMLTWVIYPPNFDPAKKYPALLYCQGGPQSMVSQFYSFRWNFQLMAAQGYIVVAPNRRGLPGFGRKWNEEISGDWGGQPMRDYLSAIDEVAKEPYVDSDNLGCIGASYGGYSAYMLAGIHEKRFKAFISHAGLFDLESWYLSTEEMWFANKDLGGPFWKPENETTYQKYDPKDYVENWDTPLMVIHGAQDFRVPINQGMEAFQAAKLRGIPTKFLYFPEEGHWILSPQNGLVWHDQFFGWLEQWLK